MKLSIIIPVYNEEKTIGKIIQCVLDARVAHEIIIVNDFSTDKTKNIIEDLNKRYPELII